MPEILAIPTDTCYGLACSIDDASSYDWLYRLKGRDFTKPLAIIVRSFDDLHEYIEITDSELHFLEAYPFPFTILWKPKLLPSFLDPYRYTLLGLRVAEKCLAPLFHDLPFPLFLTSANRSWEKECMTREEVRAVFGDAVTVLWEASPWKPPSNIFFFTATGIHFIRKNYP